MALPCEKLWPALKNAMAILAEKCPAFIESCEFVKGDGGVGSIRLVKFGPASGLVKFSKEEVVEIDNEKMVITCLLLEGDLTNAFTLFKPSMSISPSDTPSSSILTYTLNYIPIPQYSPQIDLLNQGTTMFFKTLENFLLNSPPNPTTSMASDLQTPCVEPTLTKSTHSPTKIINSHTPTNLSPKSVLPPPNHASEFTPLDLPTPKITCPPPSNTDCSTAPSTIDPSNVATINNLTSNLSLTKPSSTPNGTMNSSSPHPHATNVLQPSSTDSQATIVTPKETLHVPLHLTPSKEETHAPIPIVSS